MTPLKSFPQMEMANKCSTNRKKKSMFNWFAKKQPVVTTEPERSSLGFSDETVPMMPSDRIRLKRAAVPVTPSVSQKNERLERRELLYKVVHDSMIRAGVLATSYKFKVLSLDTHGLQYLIMMDMADQSVADTRRLAEIETIMAQAAKARYDILVTAVYWRVNEQITTGLSRAQAVSVTRPPMHSPAAGSIKPATSSKQVNKQGEGFEPLQQEEVDAFKRALASATPHAEPMKPGQTVTSGRRNPAPADDFEDTHLVDTSDRSTSPLSMTQYGDLN